MLGDHGHTHGHGDDHSHDPVGHDDYMTTKNDSHHDYDDHEVGL